VVRVALFFVVFWVMQALIACVFKYGTTGGQSRWLWGFIVGNTFGVTSTWFLMMLLHRLTNANVGLALATGGAFLFGQIAIALCFRSHLNVVQYLGVAAILAGMLCVCLGATPEKKVAGGAALAEHTADVAAGG
jgi:hypothetical protein